MAHSLSAKKRIRQNAKSRALNRWRKRRFREPMREYRELLLHGTVEQAESKLQELYKVFDQVAAKGTIHRNAAARYKSRMAKRLNHKRQGADATATA